jgi:hypothetical protein
MARPVSEDQQQLDDRERAIIRSDVPQKINAAISRALNELAETGIETGKYELRHEHCQAKREEDVRGRLERQIEDSKADIADPQAIILFFEYARKRCYDLDDATNASSTIRAFAQATSTSIDHYLQQSSPVAADRLLLSIIGKFLLLLGEDIAVYQGINRGSNHEVIEGLQREAKTCQEILEMLDSAGASDRSSALEGWRAQLVRELHAEALALSEVSRGIHCATRALAQFEDEVRRYYNKDCGPSWPDRMQITGLTDACSQVSEMIASLDEDREQWRQELRPASLAWVSGIASRLNPWKSLLRSLAATYGDSKPMPLPAVRIRYLFPFTVGNNEVRGDLSPALRRRIPGDQTITKGESQRELNSLDSELGARLKCLGQGTPEVEPLKLSDFWTAAGEGMFGGNRVHLPALADVDNRDDQWMVWVDLSRLGNHCLCIERALDNPTPHELYKALRCPGDYSWNWKYRYEWPSGQLASRSSEQAMPENYRWRSVDEFAHDVILVMAQGLTGSARPEYLKGHFHEVTMVTTGVSIEELDSLYGAQLFRTNLHRDSATLEEWLRYPAAKHGGRLDATQARFGYTENWLSVLDDATIFGLAGNPSWQADSYLEAVQFAVSWAPGLLLWNRQLMQALEETGTKRGSDLRQLEQDVRRSVAVARAEELCRLPSDRRFLDSILSSVGITRMEQDLERQIHAVQLLIAANERSAQDSKDSRRNFFLGALALFSVLNLSTVFGVLNAGDNNGFFKNQSAIRWEFTGQIGLVVLFGLVWLSTYFLKRRP